MLLVSEQEAKCNQKQENGANAASSVGHWTAVACNHARTVQAQLANNGICKMV